MGKIKNTLSDKTIIGMITAGATLAEVARKAGVCRMRMNQIYNERLSKEFGYLTPRQLRKHVTLQRQLKAGVPYNPAMKTVIDSAELLNLNVEAVPVSCGRGRIRKSKRRLLICGRRCQVAYSNHAAKTTNTGTRKYFRIWGSWEWPEFVIWILPVGTLILPNIPRLPKTLYISEVPNLPVYHNIEPLVNWWLFKDRWDLLNESKARVL